LGSNLGAAVNGVQRVPPQPVNQPTNTTARRLQYAWKVLSEADLVKVR
jgi:hypothetical protein